MLYNNIVINRLKLKVLILCLAGVIIGLAVSWGVFDAVPHLEDEHAYLFQAKLFACGKITREVLPSAPSFSLPFVIEYNGKQFSKYTPGFSLILALGALVRLPWIINPLLAGVGIFAVFLLTRELFDEKTGLLAAALGVISPMYMLLAGSFLSHTLTLVLLTFFTWSFFRLHRVEPEARMRYAILCGLLMGFTILTRPWTGAAVGLPFVVYALVRFFQSPKPLFKPYLMALLLAVLIAGLIPLYNFITTGDPLLNTYTLIWEYDRVGIGPEYGPSGYNLEKLWINFKGDFQDLQLFNLGWPVIGGISVSAIFILLGIILPKRQKLEACLLLPAVTLIAAYMVYWASSGGMFGPRYYAEALPFLWILAARGVLKFAQYPINKWIIRVALLVFTMWNIIMVSKPAFDNARDLYNINRDYVRLVERADIHHAIVFVTSNYWTDYANLSWNNPANLEKADIIYARDIGSNSNGVIIEAFPGRDIYHLNLETPPYLTPANP